MKKIITLMLAFVAFSTAFAQTSRKIEEARDIILKNPDNRTTRDYPNDDRGVYGDRDSRYPSGSRESRIDEINRRYDQKIYSIRNNRSLSASEKRAIIRELEEKRAREIREVNEDYRRDDDRRYDNDRRRYDDDDRYDKKNKKYKHNNGKRKGWEKGKGNPHRGRS